MVKWKYEHEWYDQSLNARLKQHKNPNVIQAQNSAVFNHIMETGHPVGKENTFILDNEEQRQRRGIKEAIWERVETPFPINRNGGLHYQGSHIWDRACKALLFC